jgi:CheY-like chemotaxis protein
MATVLYIEDHPPARLLMHAIIEEMTTHRLEVAASGEEGLRQAQALTPDLYIVDLDLPDTDGLTLARALLKVHPAPVLLVSAYAEAVKDPTVGTAIHAYLAKPLDPVDVADTIERTLAHLAQ